MKLANKYELLDPLTTGAVETFVGRELASGQRVLVHVFEGGVPPSDPPTSEWAVAGMLVLAPPPPGEVLDVGRYPGSTFAYLVTKVPEAETLQKWVLAYESQVKATPLPPVAVTAASPSSQAGTRPAGSEPGLGTAVFSSPIKAVETGSSVPRRRDTAAVPSPVPIPERTPTRPKESFTSMFQSAGIPVESESAGVPAHEAKAGDFTSFFRGPFTGKASETPNLAPPPPEPGSRPGEFTQVFGARKGSPQEEPAAEPSVRSAAPLNEPGGFTQLFASTTPGSVGYEAPAEEKPVSSENPFIFDKPTWTPQIPTQPPTPVPPKNPFEGLPAAAPPLSKAGPSEYTMIVSGGRAPAAPDEPPIAGGANPPAAKPGGFAMPKPAAIPAVPIPKIPAAPPMPAVPPAPKMPTLSAPKAPQAPDAPKPPMSYMPLILAMTVLFFAAAMLVLYFALKH